MMLESSLSDLRDSQGVSLHHVPSLLRLLRLLQDFLFAEGTDNQTLWSEKVGNGLIYSYSDKRFYNSHTLISNPEEFETKSWRKSKMRMFTLHTNPIWLSNLLEKKLYLETDH